MQLMLTMLDSGSSPSLLICHTTSETHGLFKALVSLMVIRARLQYDVAQQPRFLDQLPTPLVELLQKTLHSHRLALTIDQDNADLLLYAFATSQGDCADN